MRGQISLSIDLKLSDFNSIEIHQDFFQGNFIKLTPYGLLCRRITGIDSDTILFVPNVEVKEKYLKKVLYFLNKKALHNIYPDEIFNKTTPSNSFATYFYFHENLSDVKCVIDFCQTKDFIKLIKLFNELVPKDSRKLFALKVGR